MKLSDYVMNFISGLGVQKVFYVSGGGAMHLNNSLGQNKALEGICMLHEQSCSIAAESYARISENYGVCLVTSGPGSTNTVTGVAGSYIDSIPVIYISGQAKRDDLVGEQQIRQFGIQEVDIVSVVKPITKYAVQIKQPEDIKYEMQKAAQIAANGRPGPVWIDIPLDIQASQIEESKLREFNSESLPSYKCRDSDIDKTIEMFNKSERPVLVLGGGIRLSGGVSQAREIYEFLGVPCLTTWNGVDLIEDEHPLFYGRPGAVGHRHSNFIQQNADLVITIGTRLNLLSTGYNYDSFLSNSFHIMVDIDEHEMHKKNVHPQLRICSDAKDFIISLLKRRNEINNSKRTRWIEHCNALKEKYPLFIPEQSPLPGFVSTYDLVSEISDHMTGDDIFQFTSSGSSVDISMKTFRIKKGQRAFLTKGLAAMGYDLPASIGSCIASGGKRTVCVTGDGSIMMNIQELEVIRRLKLPVKMFVVDNNGYGMIYNSQKSNFNGNLTGCTEESGLTLPDPGKIAEGFDIKVFRIQTKEKISQTVEDVMKYDGPAVCVVKSDISQKILPKQANYVRDDGQMASRPLEDMFPLLDREEYERNLL